MILKKYNNSLKKFIYLTIVGPILGLTYIFINRLVLNYLYHSFLNNKKANLIILRSFIDFYYSKQNKDKKKLLDNKLFFYSPVYQKESLTIKKTMHPHCEIGRHKGLKTLGINEFNSLRQSQVVSKHYQS